MMYVVLFGEVCYNVAMMNEDVGIGNTFLVEVLDKTYTIKSLVRYKAKKEAAKLYNEQMGTNYPLMFLYSQCKVRLLGDRSKYAETFSQGGRGWKVELLGQVYTVEAPTGMMAKKKAIELYKSKVEGSEVTYSITELYSLSKAVVLEDKRFRDGSIKSVSEAEKRIGGVTATLRLLSSSYFLSKYPYEVAYEYKVPGSLKRIDIFCGDMVREAVVGEIKRSGRDCGSLPAQLYNYYSSLEGLGVEGIVLYGVLSSFAHARLVRSSPDILRLLSNLPLKEGGEVRLLVIDLETGQIRDLGTEDFLKVTTLSKKEEPESKLLRAIFGVELPKRSLLGDYAASDKVV